MEPLTILYVLILLLIIINLSLLYLIYQILNKADNKHEPTSIVNEVEDEEVWLEKLKNSNDYYLIESLIKRFKGNNKIASAIYKKLLVNYKNEDDISIKRELLKLLDRLTDDMLEYSTPKNYEETKDIKIKTERLYAELATYIQNNEKQLIETKINKLKDLLSQIEDMTGLDESSEVVREIQKIDSSIDKNFLQNEDKLQKKYDQVLKKLSAEIEALQKEYKLNENRRAMRNAKRLKKKFNQKRSFLGGDLETKLITDLVKNLNLETYDGLLPATYQYCEKVRNELVESLTEKQRINYVKKMYESKLNE